ncbi:MAG: hypothetical protein WC319_07275 [Candidatus Paceibacterota bacterium]|jgi:hypothetical protein
MADETNINQGDGGEVQTSADENGTTLQPETFTKEQLDKQVSDALAAAGRTATALQEKEASLAQKEAELADKERQAALAEEEAVKNDPSKLNVLRERRALKEQQAALAKQKAEIERERKRLEADQGEVAKIKLERKAAELAEQYGVSKEVLMLMPTAEAMDAVAPKLPKATPDGSNQNQSFKPFSGKTQGQGNDLSKLSPEQKIMYGLEHPAKKP